MRLYLFKSAMCAHCAEAEKHLAEWERLNFGRLIVLRVDPNLFDWRPGGFSPKATPSYAIVHGTQLLEAVDGKILEPSEIDALIASAETKAEHAE